MSELSLMMFDDGFERRIRCRFISDWFKMDSYVSNAEMLLLEIGKIKPLVVMLDLDLYGKIGGIEISNKIRIRFDTQLIYV